MTMDNPRAVIAEDEPLLRDELQEALARHWPELQVVAAVDDGVQALAALERWQPQVLFLDIEMPSLDGLAVAAAASGRSHVVFVTAYGHYALDAFERGAVDYLLKPVAPERLAQALSRLRERLRAAPPGLEALLRQLGEDRRAAAPLRWITVSRGRSLRLLTCDEVCYFQADHKYTRVVTAAEQSLITRPIRQLRQELDPDTFLQIHRGTIVNLRAIESVDRDLRGGLSVRLRERPERLAVSASFVHVFRQM
jgi:DNA-binding LytR/AlgR family response regulator